MPEEISRHESIGGAVIGNPFCHQNRIKPQSKGNPKQDQKYLLFIEVFYKKRYLTIFDRHAHSPTASKDE